MEVEKVNCPLLEWGIAQMAAAGQTESGDRHLVKPFPNGVLVGVADGLGHGEEAACAAKVAVSTLENYAQESVISLVRRCDTNLRRTRGAVMSLATFNGLDGTMTWLGIGNVEGMLLRADAGQRSRQEHLLLRGGVVGGDLPPLQAMVMPVMPGDMLIFATDGIKGSFGQELYPRGLGQRLRVSDPPQRLADRILAGYSWGTDDALVLVARYVGTQSKDGKDAA